MENDLELTIITSHIPKVLSKSFSLDSQGALQKQSGGKLIEGTAERRGVSLKGFVSLLKELKPNQALSFGIADHERATIVPQETLAKRSRNGDGPVISRDRKHFAWGDGPGILMVDYDPPRDTPPLGKEELLQALYAAWPALQTSPHIWCASASSCIHRIDTGEELRGVRGQRVYIPITHAKDIPRAASILSENLWLHGHGRFDVSKSGSLLERTIVDGAVHQPERLDFAGGAACGEGLEQRRPAPVAYNLDAPFIDTRATLPDLTPEEEQQVERLKAAARAAKKGESEKRKAEWIEARVAEGIRGVSKEKHEAERVRLYDLYRRAVDEKRLFGDFVLHSAKHGRVTVGEVLDNPTKFHNARFADPLEPDYGNDFRIAVVNLRCAGRPYLWSHAHGGQRFTLHRALQTIRIQGGELHNITARLLELMKLDGTIFDRGGELVRLADGRVVRITPEWLTYYATALARFEKYDGRSKQWIAIDCPQNVAKVVCEMQGSWGLPALEGIISAPTTTPSGRVIEVDGHDADTRLYLDFPDSEKWSGIPSNPTPKESKEAAERLFDPFLEFPFKSPADRGALLSALLTAVTRPVLPTAPGFLFTAPTAGSGKTLLARCIAALAGEQAEIIMISDTDEEMRKRLFSLSRTGAGVILLDNVTGAFRSDSLCAYLTADRMTERPLGTSTMISLPIKALFLVTGNNVLPVGDLNRRLLRIDIDPLCEQPFLRRFELDPLAYIQTNRLSLVRAAIVLLKAYLASGAERPHGRLASFEVWSDFIRGAVVWIGANEWLDVADPVESLTSSYAVDPDTQKLGALLDIWRELFGKSGATVAEAIRTAKGNPNGDLSAILEEIAGEHNCINSRRLGRWIEGREGRIVGGFRILRRGTRKHAVIWRVEDAAGVSLESLVSFFPNPPRECQADSLYKEYENNSPNSPNSPIFDEGLDDASRH